MAESRGSVVSSMQPGHYGAAGTGVALAEATIAAAWNVQGDPSRPSFVDNVRRLFDIPLPLAPHTTTRTDALTALWLGPASWLLVASAASPLVDYVAKRDALSAAGGALFDVSAGRVAWTLSGPRVADVLAKGCPLDIHPRAFTTGTCAQSVYGHVNVLIDKRDDAPTFNVMFARSFAHDVWRSLSEASAQYGIDIGPPLPFR